MVSACSIILFLLLILSWRVDVVFGGGVVGRRGVCRGLAVVQKWIDVLLLSFPPIIVLLRVVGL